MKMIHINLQFDALLSMVSNSALESQPVDMDEKSKTLRRRLLIDNAKIVHCLDDLGLLGAYEVWLYFNVLLH